MRSKLLKIVGIFFLGVTGLILLALAIYTILFYPRKAESFKINDVSQPRNILIATQGSDFKDNFTKVLCDSLKNPSVHIQGIDVGELGQMNGDEWDRIIIINSFIIRLNKKVERFIKSTSESEKILVFVTSGGNDWQPSSNFEVDAITSASRDAYINDLVHLIIEWFEKDSNQNWQPDDQLLALVYVPHTDVKAACKRIEAEQEGYRVLYPNLEDLINRAGYHLMRLEDASSAMEIFRLNVDLFPDSWNAYDSYGDALLESGDRESAIMNYQKALELNPLNKSSGEKLKKMGPDK